MCSVSRHACRIAWVESGAFAATWSASSSARQRLPVGCDLSDEADLLRFGRGIGGHASRMSIASVYGICRGSRHADPPSGKSPRFASHTPKIALSPATRMSVPCSISVPPATA